MRTPWTKGTIVAALVAVLASACAGPGPGAGATTTTPDAVTTTGPVVTTGPGMSSTTSAPVTTGLPGECTDAIVELLRDMEPIIDGAGIDHVGSDAFEGADALADLGERHLERLVSLDCPELGGPEGFASAEGFAVYLEVARVHAPGTVRFLEESAAVAAAREQASQPIDCDDALAAASEFFEGIGSIDDLPEAEQFDASLRVTSVMVSCPPDIVAEFMAGIG